METKEARKSIARLMQERNEYRKLLHKIFVHRKSGEHYQLINLAFLEADNTLCAVYCLCAMSRLTFVRRIDEFVDRFDPLETGGTVAA